MELGDTGGDWEGRRRRECAWPLPPPCPLVGLTRFLWLLDLPRPVLAPPLPLPLLLLLLLPPLPVLREVEVTLVARGRVAMLLAASSAVKSVTPILASF